MGNRLSPHHRSMRGSRRRPYGYSEMKMKPEQIEMTERMALEIFTDMTMNGHTFIQAIAAIYLTGIENGATACARGGDDA